MGALSQLQEDNDSLKVDSDSQNAQIEHLKELNSQHSMRNESWEKATQQSTAEIELLSQDHQKFAAQLAGKDEQIQKMVNLNEELRHSIEDHQVLRTQLGEMSAQFETT